MLNLHAAAAAPQAFERLLRKTHAQHKEVLSARTPALGHGARFTQKSIDAWRQLRSANLPVPRDRRMGLNVPEDSRHYEALNQHSGSPVMIYAMPIMQVAWIVHQASASVHLRDASGAALMVVHARVLNLNATLLTASREG